MKWIEQEGEQGATREKLATALTNIGLQNLADSLIGMWLRLCIKPEQNSDNITLRIDLWYNQHPLTYPGGGGGYSHIWVYTGICHGIG